MADYADPAYDLSEVKEKARVGFVVFRTVALESAAELDLDQRDITDCIAALLETDFDKSMDARIEKWAGRRQDVYRPTYCGVKLYLKIQYTPQKRLFVVSFKRE